MFTRTMSIYLYNKNKKNIHEFFQRDVSSLQSPEQNIIFQTSDTSYPSTTDPAQPNNVFLIIF